MEKRALVWAGHLLMGIAGWQLAGLAWFCWAGGIEGMVSPVAAFAVVWPIAALLGYIGWRMRGYAIL